MILGSASDDKKVKLWNIETKQLIVAFEGHKDFVKSLAFNINESLLASGSWDGSIKIWNIKT